MPGGTRVLHVPTPRCSQAKEHWGALLSPARGPLITTSAGGSLSPGLLPMGCSAGAQLQPAVSPQPQSLTPSTTSPLEAHVQVQLGSPGGQHHSASWLAERAQTLLQLGAGMSWSVRQQLHSHRFLAGNSPKPPVEQTQALPPDHHQQTGAQGQPLLAVKTKACSGCIKKNPNTNLSFPPTLK